MGQKVLGQEVGHHLVEISTNLVDISTMVADVFLQNCCKKIAKFFRLATVF